MSIITPAQSREARRELGVSQADVAGAVGISRPYLSDFESGNLIRLTKNQLRKLRSHYEEKISAAKEAGEDIEITFGEAVPSVLPIRIEQVASSQCVFPIGKGVPAETVAATLATISEIDKKLATLLTCAAQRDAGFWGSGEFSEETLAAFREAFALLACNYLLIRTIGGWPEIGLSASGMAIAENTVLAEMFKEVTPYFEQAGLLVEVDAQEQDEEEAA